MKLEWLLEGLVRFLKPWIGPHLSRFLLWIKKEFFLNTWVGTKREIFLETFYSCLVYCIGIGVDTNNLLVGLISLQGKFLCWNINLFFCLFQDDRSTKGCHRPPLIPTKRRPLERRVHEVTWRDGSLQTGAIPVVVGIHVVGTKRSVGSCQVGLNGVMF